MENNVVHINQKVDFQELQTHIQKLAKEFVKESNDDKDLIIECGDLTLYTTFAGVAVMNTLEAAKLSFQDSLVMIFAVLDRVFLDLIDSNPENKEEINTMAKKCVVRFLEKMRGP